MSFSFFFFFYLSVLRRKFSSQFLCACSHKSTKSILSQLECVSVCVCVCVCVCVSMQKYSEMTIPAVAHC